MQIVQSGVKFKGLLSYNNKPSMIVLHHADSVKCTVQDVHAWHLSNGWSGIGYQYFVAKTGIIYTGRPEGAQGAHCPGTNTRSIGICAEGNYTTEKTMPAAQMKAIIELCTSLVNKYHISVSQVKGHKDVPYSTTCPGTFYPMNQIKAGIGKVKVTNTPTQVKVATTTTNDGLINFGDKGAAVKSVQLKLQSLGYALGNCGADSDFGMGTKVSVMAFQKAMEVTADGIVGATTLSILNEVAAKPLLKLDTDYSYATKFVQFKLGIGIDGDFGPGTYNAVKAFQMKKQILADGIVGSGTWSKLI